MKIKVYIMHSDKIKYKDELYKPLLENGLMNDYYLILPMAERFITEYVKDLIKDSDIIICNLTKSNFFLREEQKWATKLNKVIYYFIDNKDPKISKYKNLNVNIYNTNEELVEMIKLVLNSLDKKTIILKRENIYCLGKVQK